MLYLTYLWVADQFGVHEKTFGKDHSAAEVI